MARIGVAFNPKEVKPTSGFIDVPPGKYVMQIVHNEDETAKTGAKMAKFRWQVLEGEYENQCVFQQSVYQKSNGDANEVGMGEISAICEAVNYTDHLDDMDVLMWQPCIVTVGWSKPQAGYERKPEVKKVQAYSPDIATGAAVTPPAARPAATVTQMKPAAAATARPAAPAAKPASAPAVPAGAARPWQTKK